MYSGTFIQSFSAEGDYVELNNYLTTGIDSTFIFFLCGSYQRIIKIYSTYKYAAIIIYNCVLGTEIDSKKS